MQQQLLRHKLAYSLLIIFLVTTIVLFLGAWPNRGLQRLIAVSIAVFYSLWGILTHFKARKITRQVVLEYVGVGFLAGLLLVLITL